MRTLLTTAAILFAATAAHAGSYSPAGGKAYVGAVVTGPATECTGILVGGCGYCIGGKVIHM